MAAVPPGWLINAGYAFAALLVAVPVFLAARVCVAIVRDLIQQRSAERRRVNGELPGLGEFSSTGDLWFGEVSRLLVGIDSPGHPPGESEVRQIRGILAALPTHVDDASGLILADPESREFLPGRAGEFRPTSLYLDRNGDFVLELERAGDATGVFRVEFRDGTARAWGWED